MSTILGQKIKELRKKKGLTLEKLAELSKSSKSYVWELENKELPRPSAEKISKIATSLGVTIEYLIDQKDKVTEADAIDKTFFRKYQNMDSKVKEKVRKMIDLWEDEE